MEQHQEQTQLELDGYWNTNKEKGNVLKESRKKANAQDNRILEYFMKYEGHDFSRHDISSLVFNESIPYTSVQRSITNLTSAGYLIKNGKEKMTKAPTGKKVHTWKYSGKKIFNEA